MINKKKYEYTEESYKSTLKALKLIEKNIKNKISVDFFDIFQIARANFSMYYLRKYLTNNTYLKSSKLKVTKQIIKFFIASIFGLFKKKNNKSYDYVFYISDYKFLFSVTEMIKELSKKNKILILSEIKFNQLDIKNVNTEIVSSYLNFFDFIKVMINFLIFNIELINVDIKHIKIFKIWAKNNLIKFCFSLKIVDKIFREIDFKKIIIVDPQDAISQSISYKQNIKKVIYFQFGLVAKEDMEYCFERTKYMFVFDKYSKNVIINHSKNSLIKRKYYISGMYKFSNNSFKLGYKKSRIIFFNIVPKIKKIQEVESFFNIDEVKEIIFNLNLFGKEIKKNIYLKIHPQDKFNYKNFLIEKKLLKIKLIEKSENSLNLLNKFDIVITTHSTTGLEALYKNKWLFILDNKKRNNHFFKFNRIGIIVKTPSDIVNNIKKIKNQVFRKNFLISRDNYFKKNNLKNINYAKNSCNLLTKI
jgi:hypothetical protein